MTPHVNQAIDHHGNGDEPPDQQMAAEPRRFVLCANNLKGTKKKGAEPETAAAAGGARRRGACWESAARSVRQRKLTRDLTRFKVATLRSEDRARSRKQFESLQMFSRAALHPAGRAHRSIKIRSSFLPLINRTDPCVFEQFIKLTDLQLFL